MKYPWKNPLKYTKRELLCSVNAENRLFDEFETNVKYKHWYFGHYHVDGDINERKTVVYENVLPIE